MNYGEHFKSRVLVEATTENYGLIVEGKISREDERSLYLEDAYILKNRKVYQSPEVMINKEFIDSVDSAKQGEIFEIAKEDYDDSLSEMSIIMVPSTFLTSLLFALAVSSALKFL